MATSDIYYAAAATIACTTASLANAGWRASDVVDNTSNLYVDALLGGSIQVGTLSATGSLEVYAYASYDGSTYTEAMTGSDSGITWGTTPANSGVQGYFNIRQVAYIVTDSADDNKDLKFGPVSMATVFGGTLPPKWGVIVKNNTGATLNATGTSNTIKYTGVKYTTA